MKYLVFLFILVSLVTRGQVVIPEDVARYFLKRNDVAEILEKRDSLYVSLIDSYTAEIHQKDKLILSCETEAIAVKQNLDFLQKKSMDMLTQNKTLTKLLAREQRKVKYCLIGMIIVALL